MLEMEIYTWNIVFSIMLPFVTQNFNVRFTILNHLILIASQIPYNRMFPVIHTHTHVHTDGRTYVSIIKLLWASVPDSVLPWQQEELLKLDGD